MQFFTSFVLSAMHDIIAVCADASNPTPPRSALNDWAQTTVSGLLQATSVAALTTASDAFFADDVSIVLNGKVFTVAEYNAQRLGLGFNGTTTVKISAGLEVPTVANSSLAGEVALFFNVQVMGIPDVASTMNLIIRPDPFVSGPDTRRVYSLDQVATLQIQT
ncbi:hypothetical protein C8F04DRAFT_1393866 [Mycena alexandri]|uniref:Uncharacterized protein n=1 Tax=Mycena alexandri TaxID=1745969 RepID=A0AAD6T0F1_9AGAR|nr:hypothetical protein C8F04DRAFT_1393866 [Mycena alexandri]